ncbi:hypothetical protein Tco_0687167, partial [Tanacetum coccineum]
GSAFNVQGGNAFNSFIASAGLEEVPLGGGSSWRRFLLEDALSRGVINQLQR